MKDVMLVSRVVPGEINANFEEFFANVRTEVEPYQGLVFTDEQMGDAKKLVAKLNKDRKGVEDRRKDVKKTWLLPYDAFEKKVKEALAIIDGAINPLKDQISVAEQKRISDRKEQVNNIITQSLANKPSSDFIRSCGWFYDQRWENSSVTLKTVLKQVEDKVTEIETNISVIMTMDYSKEILAKYRETGNIAEALLMRETLAQAQRQIDELEERLKAQKVYPEATEDPIEDAVISEDPEIPEEPVEEVQYGQAPPELMTITFSVTGTKEQLQYLKDFCSDNGIVIQRA